MKFLSDRMTSASGSIGGTTFSHNKGGMYTRARRVPTNPNSESQQFARTRFAAASARWSTVLTQTQRDHWNEYAMTQSHVNKLGASIKWSGQQEYIASNQLLGMVGTALIADPPVILTKPAFSVSAFTADSDGIMSITTNTLAAVANAKVFAGISRAMSPGIAYFKGPFQQDAPINVAAGGTSWVPVTGFTFVGGQRVFGRFVYVLPDGRYSAAAILTTIVEAV